MSESADTDRGGLHALDQRPMSPRQRYAALLVAFGEFIDGYDLLVIGGALIFLRPQFHLSPAETGALGAAGFLGAMLGLVVFGDMSDRLGRRSIFVANLVFFVVFSIVSAFITSVPQLFVVRFLVGMGVGMDIPTSTAYLAEIAPARHRGKVLGALTQITWILGALTSTLVAIPLQWMFGDAAWRWMFGLAALPAALVLLGRQGLPESPRWLIAHGRTEEAQRALASFGIEATDKQLISTGGRGCWGELFRPPMRRRVWWVAAIFFLNCLAGPVATVATPYVIRTVGAFSMQTTLLFSTLVWGTSLLGSIGSFLLIDRIGRKLLCYLSLLPAACLALLMGVTAGSSPTMLVIGYFAFSFFIWLGGPSLQWGWSSELFPTRLRGRSQGFCNGMCRLAIAINIFLVPVALASIGFGPFIALLSLPLFGYALIVNRIDMFESAGLSLEALETHASPSQDSDALKKEEVPVIRTLGWLLFALVLLVILPTVIILPLLGLPETVGPLHFARVDKYDAYGAWLAGALTPLLILVGLMSWWFQKMGQDRANQIQVQTLVLTNVHELYGRINYMAFCATIGRHPEPGELRWGNLQEVTLLLSVLRHHGRRACPSTADLPPVLPYDQIITGHFFKQLSRDLYKTTRLIQSSGLEFLIDERVLELGRAVQHFST